MADFQTLSHEEIIHYVNTRVAKTNPTMHFLRGQVLSFDEPTLTAKASFESHEQLSNGANQVQGGFAAAMLDASCAYVVSRTRREINLVANTNKGISTYAWLKDYGTFEAYQSDRHFRTEADLFETCASKQEVGLYLKSDAHGQGRGIFRDEPLTRWLRGDLGEGIADRSPNTGKIKDMKGRRFNILKRYSRVTARKAEELCWGVFEMSCSIYGKQKAKTCLTNIRNHVA